MATATSRVTASAAARRRRFDPTPYVLIAPAVLVVLAVTVYPALYSVQLSTMQANLLKVAAAKPVGLDNYARALQDEIFLGSVVRTVRWIAVVAAGQMTLALPVALLLNAAFLGRGGVRAGVLVPWVVPGPVVAIIWRFAVDANFGVVNDALYRLGIIGQYVAWMSEPVPAFLTIAGAMTWSGFPFFVVTLLAALQAIPDDLYEAARIDGASAWQSFRSVTVPLLLPTMLLLLLLRTIWLSHSVDLIFMMSQGGPGYDNYTVAVHSFLLTWNELELGYPAALAIMLSVVLLAASAVYVRLIERSQEWA